MKKRIALLLTLGMFSGIIACGQNANQNQSDISTKNTEQEADMPSETEEIVAEENVAEENETEAIVEETEVEIEKLEQDEAIEYRGKELLMSMANIDEYEGGNITLKYGDAEYELSEYAEWNSSASVFAYDDESFYVALQPCYSNDWVFTYIVKFDGNSFVDVAKHEGAVKSIDKNMISFSTRKDLLGTYGIIINMKFENDALEEIEDEIKFINEASPEVVQSFDEDENDYFKMIYNKEGYRVLTLKQPLKVDSDEGNIEIQKGEQIIPYSYNEKESLFFFKYNEKIYSFKYKVEENEYTVTIDGVSQDDLFEVLPFAG